MNQAQRRTLCAVYIHWIYLVFTPRDVAKSIWLIILAGCKNTKTRIRTKTAEGGCILCAVLLVDAMLVLCRCELKRTFLGCRHKRTNLDG